MPTTRRCTMKIFISGATGLVGYAALKRFTGAGHTVKGLVQDADSAKLIIKAGALPVIGDLMTPEPWAEQVKDCDVVLSASSPYHFGEPLSLKEAKRRAETHAEMVTNLLSAATHAHVEAVILTYHVTALGNQGERWASEILPIEPVGYARAVAGSYWEIERNARRMGLPVIEVFPGWVYGHGGWFEDYTVNGLLDGTLSIVGSGQNYISPVHVDDLTEALRLIAQKKPIGERFCIVDEMPIKQNDLMNYIADQLGVKTPPTVDYSLFASEHGDVMAEAMNSSVRVSNAKAMKELGFRAVYPSVHEGVPGLLSTMGLGPESIRAKKAAGF
jgi:nucleoside-diphosphate-sugar epimerase